MGAAGASQLFWSPNSDFIGYFDKQARKLKKVSLQGDAPITVCDLPASFRFGATWDSGNTIVFPAGKSSGLLAVPADGGEPTPLLEPDSAKSGGLRTASPLFLRPGHLLSSVWTTDGTSRIIRVRDGRMETLFELPHAEVHSLGYSPTGHLIYQRGAPWQPRGIWAVPFDVETLQNTGEPFLVEQGGRVPSVSGDGTLIYVRGSSRPSLRRLVSVNRAGKVLASIGQPQRGMEEPTLSADGSRVAVSAFADSNADIWIHDVTRGTRTRLTTHPAFDFEPTWSPSGDQVAFASIGAVRRTSS